MKNTIKIKGLKKAVGDYHRCNAGGGYSPHYGYLMFDAEDNTLWTDEFCDFGHGSWVAYSSPTIYRIDADVIMEYGKVAMQTVRQYIEKYF